MFINIFLLNYYNLRMQFKDRYRTTHDSKRTLIQKRPHFNKSANQSSSLQYFPHSFSTFICIMRCSTRRSSWLFTLSHFLSDDAEDMILPISGKKSENTEETKERLRKNFHRRTLKERKSCVVLHMTMKISSLNSHLFLIRVKLVFR